MHPGLRSLSGRRRGGAGPTRLPGGARIAHTLSFSESVRLSSVGFPVLVVRHLAQRLLHPAETNDGILSGERLIELLDVSDRVTSKELSLCIILFAGIPQCLGETAAFTKGHNIHARAVDHGGLSQNKQNQ